ncbi:MAG TPA: tol-pal system protein YbgF [Vicinamibacterales bacterium]|mgnify:FL=1|jgi:tol-pal system protein YbgF|nr:tol-pal system protein YbgF [Vicinamibacterales bacterium]|tara:strand:+ start:520 stop:1356 length:837 start_codon:yes stop_codon:yes gene_type:complete
MKRKVLFTLLGSIMLSLALSHPLSAQSDEERQIMADLRILQMQTQELALMVAILTKALDDMSLSVTDQAAINRQAFADSRLLVDTVANSIRVLREKVDDTNVRISSFSQEIEALRMSIPRFPATVDDSEATESEGEQVSAPSPEPPLPTNPGISPQRLYDNAWADYSTGQWSLAIAGFDTYIKTFPRSDLADDAQFYIGETHYNDGRFADAVLAYDEVIVNHSEGNAVPEAQYKKGLALDRLGDTDQARETFQTVLDSFPDSRMAALALQALNRLNRP